MSGLLTNVLLPGIIIFGIVYLVVIFLFDLLLRGFLPFIPSRPWVVSQLLNELKLPDKPIKMIAFSTGRSGFFHALESRYPKANLTGIEIKTFPYVVSRVQAILRHTRIKIIKQPVHRVNVRDADFIYCHLNPEEMRGIGKKFKFECRPDTIIVSTGFNVPPLQPRKIVDLPDRLGRMDWLSRNLKLFQRKAKKFKKEKKAFIYVI